MLLVLLTGMTFYKICNVLIIRVLLPPPALSSHPPSALLGAEEQGVNNSLPRRQAPYSEDQSGGAHPDALHSQAESAALKESPREKMENIEFLRIVFTLIIVGHHFLGKLQIWNVSWQAVNLFFILSGFFLAKTFSPDKNVGRYIINSFIRFSPLILLGACLRCLYKTKFSIEGILSEVFFLSSTGIYDGRPYNTVSWYISVLFWVLLLYLYILKTRKRETVNLIFSIIAFLGIIGLNKRGFRLEFLGDKGDIGYLFEMTLVYGLALVAVGYFTWIIYEQVCSKAQATWRGKIVCTLLEGSLLVYSIAMMYFKEISTNNFAVSCVIFSALVVLFSLKIGYFSRLLEWNIWAKLSKYCLAVYLIQGVVVWEIFPRILADNKGALMEHKTFTILAVLALCCLIGIWAHHVVEKPCAKWLKRSFSSK